MIDTKQIKSIGEFYACTRLAMNGWHPALTRDGIERTDILAIDAENSRAISIQVKTTSSHGWRLNIPKINASKQNTEWFVLVKVDIDSSRLQSFIVPWDHLTAGAWALHQNWLTDPDQKPGKRNAGADKAIIGTDVFSSYEDRWDLLENATDEAPVLLDQTIRELILGPRIGLPDWHPWKDNPPSWLQ